MMLKPWTWLLLAGCIWCSLVVGVLLGNIGVPHPAYVGGIEEVIAGFLMSFVPLVIGIHAGVSYMREEYGKVAEKV
jgi:hypothetical protein